MSVSTSRPVSLGTVALAVIATLVAPHPLPAVEPWTVAPDFQIDVVAESLRLPVNIAFVPNPGPNPSDPLFYVAEMYGSIQVVRRDGAMSVFVFGLLDYNPSGPIPGSGEQGLIGLVVDPLFGNGTNDDLYVSMLWDNGSPPGGAIHYPKVERLRATVGGLTLASRTVLVNMQPETQLATRAISNLSFGPDGKLYVHVGDGFDASSALNLDQHRGKILRMNKDGTPVATGDPAGANPFYNAANGINARDYVYAYGFRHPPGGAWRDADGSHYGVERGNSLDRMFRVVAGMSYGWNGTDGSLLPAARYVWSPAVSPANIAIVQASTQGGSGFPVTYHDRAYVTQSGPTYGNGPGTGGNKCIVEFSDLTTLNGGGTLAVPPRTIAQYNGTGRATAAALAAGPDGLYFSDLYEDTGSGGATGVGARILRLRHVPRIAADMNCDLLVNTLDIMPFVTALLSPAQYDLDFPDCDIQNGELTGDDSLNGLDLDPFVECVLNAGCP